MFRKVRYKVTSRIRVYKDNWKRKSLAYYGNNTVMGKYWGGGLNWSSSGLINKLFANEKFEPSPKVLLSIMNNLYIEKIKKIHASLPFSNFDPLRQIKVIYQQYSMLSVVCQLNLPDYCRP